ncbi:MAG: DrmB family protein, partial [Candidatus Binatia bacterium]
YAECSLKPEERRKLLWRKPPQEEEEWLPAFKVSGEGIYLELNEEKLERWENREDVIRRVKRLKLRYNQARTNRGLESRGITARFILLHTFAHLLMNRLTFECGYSSASLRERLYVSAHPLCPMAGVLVYTAAGDTEGTMGGLVRMGKQGYLEPTVQRALEEARWCSVDPVCMELGTSGGQGPNSCNLAACHNCALVPETACEEFNQLLDRALVIGEPENRDIGYFDF